MKLTIAILLSWVWIGASYSAFALPQHKTEHLFSVERSKNKNVVQYDASLTQNSDLPDARPVAVYWILENGSREDLDPIEKIVYGIASQVRIAKNKFKLILTALKHREIVIDKINGSFKAMVSINGKESILEKVYVKTEEKGMSRPNVLYFDLIGKSVQTNLPVKERITPAR